MSQPAATETNEQTAGVVGGRAFTSEDYAYLEGLLRQNVNTPVLSALLSNNLNVILGALDVAVQAVSGAGQYAAKPAGGIPVISERVDDVPKVAPSVTYPPSNEQDRRNAIRDAIFNCFDDEALTVANVIWLAEAALAKGDGE